MGLGAFARSPLLSIIQLIRECGSPWSPIPTGASCSGGCSPNCGCIPNSFAPECTPTCQAIAPVRQPPSIPSSHELLFRQHAPKVQAHPIYCPSSGASRSARRKPLLVNHIFPTTCAECTLAEQLILVWIGRSVIIRFCQENVASNLVHTPVSFCQ